MFRTTFKCSKCEESQTFQHKTENYFVLDEIFSFFCRNCKNFTDHKAIKKEND